MGRPDELLERLRKVLGDVPDFPSSEEAARRFLAGLDAVNATFRAGDPRRHEAAMSVVVALCRDLARPDLSALFGHVLQELQDHRGAGAGGGRTTAELKLTGETAA